MDERKYPKAAAQAGLEGEVFVIRQQKEDRS
jgi:hypothetical protein